MNQTKSTGKSLLIQLLGLVLLITLLTIVISSGLFYYLQKESTLHDRSIFLKALGENTVTMIKRPFLQGDYTEVQSYLAVEKLPQFVESVTIFASNSGQVAYDKKLKTSTCDDKKLQSFRIPDGESVSGEVIIESTNCDLVNRFEDFLKLIVSSGLVIFSIMYFIAEKILNKTWKPVKEVIEKARDSKSLTSDLIEASPFELRPLVTQVAESYRSLAKAEVFDEMIHNLASPLRVIQYLLIKKSKGDISSLSANEKNVIVNNFFIIESYVKGKYGSEQAETNHASCSLYDVLESVVHSKRYELGERNDLIKISANLSSGDYGKFAKVSAPKLRDILSNLINNSIEARDSLKNELIVDLELSEFNEFFVVSVRDNGAGISPQNLSNIFDRGFSSKKSKGLGLSHASSVLESKGGKIEVNSTVGLGTEFKLYLPKGDVPSWFINTLDIGNFDRIVCVDDDGFSFYSWQDSLKSHEVIVLYNRFELGDFIEKNQNLDRTLFIVDFEFKGEGYTGIDLIDEFNLKNVLVATNKVNSTDVYFACLQRGIKCMPKGRHENVAIHNNRNDLQAIFLDDDRSIEYRVNELNEGHGLNVKAYLKAEELLKGVVDLPDDTLFFIDRKLGEISGIDVAKKLKNMGKHNLIAATGSSKNIFLEKEKSQFLGYVSKLDDSEEYAKIIRGETAASW